MFLDGGLRGRDNSLMLDFWDFLVSFCSVVRWQYGFNYSVKMVSGEGF